MVEIKKIGAGAPYASNCYIIISADECAIVDPSVPYDGDYLNGKTLKYILITHAHFDHFLEIDSWISKTNATVFVSNDDREALSDSFKNCNLIFLGKEFGYYGDATTLSAGDTIELGDERITADIYPGHTVGSTVYTVGNNAFVGDVVFAGGGFGRTDLPGGNAKSMLESIKRITLLDNSTVLYPGHGNITTVLEYKKHLNF